MVGKPWSEEEFQFAKQNKDEMTIKEMAEHLGRSYHSVAGKIKFEGLSGSRAESGRKSAVARGQKPWTDSEDNYLKSIYGRVPPKKIAEKLGRSVSSVRGRARRMGLDSMKRRIEKGIGLTPTKSYILSVVGPGDGFLKIGERHNEWFAGMRATDREFAETFLKKLREVYGTGYLSKIPIEKEGYQDQLEAGTGSKYVVEDLLRYAPLEHFREHTERVPDEIKEGSNGVKSSYLRGFLDSQGSVFEGRIRANKENETVIGEIISLLSDLGIESRLKKWDGTSYVVITHVENLRKFENCVGFSIGRKEERLEELTEKRLYERWGKRKVKEELTSEAERLGKSPTAKDVSENLVRRAQEYFGTWNRAKAEAGLETYPQVQPHPRGVET